MARRLDDDELIEHWTLVGEELDQVAGKRGSTRLAFALLLRFHTLHGRFPRGRGELSDEAVAYVAKLVKRGVVRSLENRPVLTHEWIEYGGSAIKG